MEERNKGLIIFGIILLAIGLVASFYSQRKYPVSSYDTTMTYPYQNVGIVLSVAGIVFAALGFLYPSHRTPPAPPTNP
jgi:uncharacterized membrane protein YidH (DUF202 family)